MRGVVSTPVPESWIVNVPPLVVTVSCAAAPATAVGVKPTSTVHDVPAVSVRQLDEALNAAAPGPTTANGLTVSVPPPVFVRVKCCVGAGVLSGVVGNVSDATDAVTAGGGSTVKGAVELTAVPAGVVIVITTFAPGVVVIGTVAITVVLLTAVNVDTAMPPITTAVAVDRLVPVIVMASPWLAADGATAVMRGVVSTPVPVSWIVTVPLLVVTVS